MERDWIRLRAIRLYGHHGVYPDERERGQLFEVDVELGGDWSRAAATDRLDEAIDYVSVYRTVAQIITGPPRMLLEALAGEIAQRLLHQFPVTRVIVRVRKPFVQMPGPVGSVEVEVSRSN